MKLRRTWWWRNSLPSRPHHVLRTAKCGLPAQIHRSSEAPLPEPDSSLTFCHVSHFHFDEVYLNFQMLQKKKKKKRSREFRILLPTRRLFWTERHLVALEINHRVLWKDTFFPQACDGDQGCQGGPASPAESTGHHLCREVGGPHRVRAEWAQTPFPALSPGQSAGGPSAWSPPSVEMRLTDAHRSYCHCEDRVSRKDRAHCSPSTQLAAWPPRVRTLSRGLGYQSVHNSSVPGTLQHLSLH